MKRAARAVALSFLLVVASKGAGAPGQAAVQLFEQKLARALTDRSAPPLRRLLPFLSADEVAALLTPQRRKVRATLRALGPLKEGPLVLVHIEDTAGDEPQVLLQTLCELRVSGASPVAIRRVPLGEAAQAFRIGTHHSSLRVDATTGATEMIDRVEILVRCPTRWIFFFLDPAREIRAVSIEAGAAEVFRLANFVALEQRISWAAGECVRVEVRSRLRLGQKKAA